MYGASDGVDVLYSTTAADKSAPPSLQMSPTDIRVVSTLGKKTNNSPNYIFLWIAAAIIHLIKKKVSKSMNNLPPTPYRFSWI